MMLLYLRVIVVGVGIPFLVAFIVAFILMNICTLLSPSPSNLRMKLRLIVVCCCYRSSL